MSANGNLGDVPRTVLRPELFQRLTKRPNAFLRVAFNPGVIFDTSQGIQKRSVILFGRVIEVRLLRRSGSPVRAVHRASR